MYLPVGACMCMLFDSTVGDDYCVFIAGDGGGDITNSYIFYLNDRCIQLYVTVQFTMLVHYGSHVIYHF